MLAFRLGRRRLIGLLLLLGSVLLWALGTVFTKIALSAGALVAPLMLVQVACGLAVVVLFLLCVDGRGGVRERQWWWLGIIEPGLAYLIGNVGLNIINATNALVLAATESFFIVLMAYIFFRRTLSPGQLITGCALFVGALMVSLPAGSSIYELGRVGFGDSLVLIGTLFSAGFVVISARLVKGTMQPAWLMFYQLFTVLGLVLLVIVATDISQLWLVSSSITFWSASSGVMIYGVSFLLYLYGLRLASIALSAFVLCLTPVFGMVFSYLLLGEHINSAYGWIGFIMVVVSMILFVWYEQHEPSHERSDGRSDES